jgi:hypothetical protein
MGNKNRMSSYASFHRNNNSGGGHQQQQQQQKPQQPQQHTNTNQQNNQNMSSFSSALNLSADAVANSPHLQKARSSALRLNSILQGKSNGGGGPSLALQTSKIRKTRSVQWDNALESATGRSTSSSSSSRNQFLLASAISSQPAAKRPRIAQSQGRLRSYKSFGRPHGGSIGGSGEAKNATFGDFGRGPALWGRDGKLMNHPSPGGGLTSSRLSNLAIESDAQQSNQNATFDFSGSRGGGGSAAPRKTTMKRTATALESWLVSNATRR